MRTKIVCGSLGIAAAGIVAWAFLRTDAKVEQPRSRRTAAIQVAEESVPTIRDIAKALPVADPAIDRNEILALIREAANAYRAREAERFNRAYLKLVAFGAPIQRILAEFLLEAGDAEERMIAGLVLKEVATAEIAPFAAALVRANVTDDVKGVGLDLLTKFRVVEASGTVEGLMFSTANPDLRRRSIDFFAAVGGVEPLAKAAVEPSFDDLREYAAKGLAKIGTPDAAKALVAAWQKTFNKKEALANYYLLQALASFQAPVLRPIVLEFLKSETDASAKNVFLSMLGRADKALALEVVRDILAQSHSPSLRRQALTVLASVGGAEAQKILLDILVAGKTQKDILDCANALLRQEKLELAFEKVRDIFGTAQNPMVRALLAGMLAKYDKEIAADPTLLAMLQSEAEQGMTNPDPALRGLACTLSATLAQYGQDPTTSLVNLYDRLPAKERDAFPQVLQELTKRSDDPRVQAILERTLADDASSTPNRLLAADALFASGSTERVYEAISSSKNSEMTTLMTGVALARGGEAAADRLETVARTTDDPAKKQMITDQLKAWSAMK